MYFLYRFLDKNNNIIYVGRTDKPLIDRITTHTHLPKECYKEKEKIEYATCQDKPTLVIYELYYINKWKPKYNVVQKYDETISLHLPELCWDIYIPDNFRTLKPIKKKNYGIDKKEKKICTNKRVWNDFKNVIDKYERKTIEEFIRLEESREIENLPPQDIEGIIEYCGKDFEDNFSDLDKLHLCFGLTYSLRGLIGGRNANFISEVGTKNGEKYYRLTFCKDKLSYWYWYIFENFYEFKEKK